MKIRSLRRDPTPLRVPQPVARRRAAEPAEDYAQEGREHRRAQRSTGGLEEALKNRGLIPFIGTATRLAPAEDQVGRALGDGDRRCVHHGLRQRGHHRGVDHA
jgi:hypothetical protein